MKIKYRNKSPRFNEPTVLSGDAPFLGATVREWDKALTGDMAATLAKVRVRALGSGPQRDVSKAVTSDLASFVGKRLANAK